MPFKNLSLLLAIVCLSLSSCYNGKEDREFRESMTEGERVRLTKITKDLLESPPFSIIDFGDHSETTVLVHAEIATGDWEPPGIALSLCSMDLVLSGGLFDCKAVVRRNNSVRWNAHRLLRIRDVIPPGSEAYKQVIVATADARWEEMKRYYEAETGTKKPLAVAGF